MEIQARAKINWTLDVVGKRADGYHLLDMLMQPLSLHDTLRIEPGEDISLVIDGVESLTAGEDNLIVRAAKALRNAADIPDGASLHLIKRIPMGAGLGGGSADAAAALKGLNAFWQLGFDLDSLCEIGVHLGADVPFCLHDAPRRARGIGELLSPISSHVFPLVLIQPCAALSTKEVFTAYHQAAFTPPDTEKAMLALTAGDLTALKEAAGNVLESASIPLRPPIAEAKEALCQNGAAFAQMTGSGSVVFGAFETEAAADGAFEKLNQQYPVCIRTATAL